MTTTTFDTLAYSKTLQDAGMPREQADALAHAQKRAVDEMVNTKELATKGDLRETELSLKKEIREVELRLLKWQFGMALALAAIMAKGFGWLGF